MLLLISPAKTLDFDKTDLEKKTKLRFLPESQELIDKIDHKKKPVDTKFDIVMTLTNKNGKIRESVLRSFSKV